MTNILTEPDAREILEPHLFKLKSVMYESLLTLNKCLTASGEQINNRALCSWLHSIAIEKAKKVFADVPNIIIRAKYQSILIVFDGKVVGRIKRINKKDLSTNAKTFRNQSIVSHRMTLFGLEPALTFVDIGYRNDATWTEFERLNIVCRLYDEVLWRIPYNDLNIVANNAPAQNQINFKEEEQITIKKIENK